MIQWELAAASLLYCTVPYTLVLEFFLFSRGHLVGGFGVGVCYNGVVLYDIIGTVPRVHNNQKRRDFVSGSLKLKLEKGFV